MGPVLSHTAALRGRKFGGNGRTRVTPSLSTSTLPTSFSTPTNLICFCFFQRVGTLVVPWELGRWAGSGLVTIGGGADLCET